jgi:hypothetical protein
MGEWLILLVLVPAIVVPVVLLAGFAGCDKVWGLPHIADQPVLLIEHAVGISGSGGLTVRHWGSCSSG